MSEKTIEILQCGPFSLRETMIEQFDEFWNSIIEQDGLTPEQQESLGEVLKQSVEKRDRLGAFLARIDADAEALRAEETRLANRRRQFEKIGACLRGSIHVQMENWGVRKVEGLKFTFAVKKNPPRVEITDEALIPAEFVDYTPSVNKSAIKQALENGDTVPGAELVQTTRLEIK